MPTQGGDCTFYNEGSMPSQEVAVGLGDVLDAQCSLSFFLVLLTLVHLCVPIAISFTLRGTPDYPTRWKKTQLFSPEAQNAPVGPALFFQVLGIRRYFRGLEVNEGLGFCKD